MKLFAAVAVILSLAPLASAQDVNGSIDPSLKLQQTAAAKQQAALRATIDAMNDGVGIGETVISYLQGQGIQVAFAPQSDAAIVAQSGPHGERTMYLSDKLALYPRVLAVAIAREAANLMYSDMQASSERDYMRDSVVARVWLELGGERAKLPVLEPITGYQNAELAAPIERWSANAETRSRTIAEQLEEQKSCIASGNYHVMPFCLDKKAKLEADAKRYDDFHKAETEWFMTNRPQ